MQKSDSIKSALSRLAVGASILAMEGQNDLTLGHLSLRDPEGRGFWIKRPDRGLDEVADAESFQLLGWDGSPVTGNEERHSEWPIHSEIFRVRSDVQVIGHTHAPYAALFSATGEDIAALNHEGASLLGDVARFDLTSGLINTVPLGKALAEALGHRSVALMKNHGITFAGASIEEAILKAIFIERACRAQLLLASSGLPWSVSEDFAADRKTETGPAGAGLYQQRFFDYLARKVSRLRLQHNAEFVPGGAL